MTYTFSKYKVTENDDGEINGIEFMFENGYNIERASLKLVSGCNELVFRKLKITTKNCDSVIEYDI